MTRRPGSLIARLLVAQIGVSVAMALTMVAVAALAGPALFEAHMNQAGHDSPEALAHSQEAFNDAGMLALGIGLVTSATGAILVSVLLTRRLRKTLGGLGEAAVQIASGDYDLRVERGDTRELATLADSFNAMAARLAGVEATRRRLLTDLAHEIRTPLASMEICVESLEDGAIEPGPEAWQILQSQLQRISRLADDLTAVSAAEEGRLELHRRTVEVAELAGAVVLAARDGFERDGIELGFATDQGAARFADVDPDRIEQVIANLLSNARRHVRPGGRVEVRVTGTGNAVLVRVSDTGDGIAPEHLPHIFERFYRVDTARDRAHGGTGVGLAISRAIAQAHGGDLSAESDGPGRGARFTLRLPAAPEPVISGAAARS